MFTSVRVRLQTQNKNSCLPTNFPVIHGIPIDIPLDPVEQFRRDWAFICPPLCRTLPPSGTRNDIISPSRRWRRNRVTASCDLPYSLFNFPFKIGAETDDDRPDRQTAPGNVVSFPPPLIANRRGHEIVLPC